MKMCPEAKIDDGLLDVTYVQNLSPDKVPELLQVVAPGGKQEDDLSESIKTMRVPWLEVCNLVPSIFPASDSEHRICNDLSKVKLCRPAVWFCIRDCHSNDSQYVLI